MSEAASDAAVEETALPVYTPKPGGADPLATRPVLDLPHDRGILACCYDPAGRYVYAGARDYLVHRWDLTVPLPEQTEEELAKAKKAKVPPVRPLPTESRTQYAGHESWAGGLAMFPAGDRLATGDFVGRLIIWSLQGKEPTLVHSIAAHEGSIRKVAVSADGKLVASAGNDHLVKLWDAGSGKLLHELKEHDCHVYNVAFHPGGDGLISADLRGRMIHWNAQTGEQVRELDASLLHTYSEKYTVDVGGIRGMAFSGDGALLACAGAVGDKGIAHSGNARVLLFDWDSGKLRHELKPEKDEISTAWGVVFHPDGFLVASGGSRTGGYLWFWTPEHDTAFHMLKFQQRAPGFDIDLAPDQRTLIVANHDGTIRLYEMAAE